MVRSRWLPISMASYAILLLIDDGLALRHIGVDDGVASRQSLSFLILLIATAVMLLGIRKPEEFMHPFAEKMTIAIALAGIAWTLYAMAADIEQVDIGPALGNVALWLVVLGAIIRAAQYRRSLSDETEADAAAYPASPDDAPTLDRPPEFRLLGGDQHVIVQRMSPEERRELSEMAMAFGTWVGLTFAAPAAIGWWLISQGQTTVGGATIAVGAAIFVPLAIHYRREMIHHLATCRWMREHWPEVAANHSAED